MANKGTDTHTQMYLQATVSPRMCKPSEFALASALGDEPGTTVAADKVEKWATMAGKQAATVASTSKKLDEAVSSSTPKSTAVTGSTEDRSSHRDTSITKKPALRLFITPKRTVRFDTPVSRDESITPISARTVRFATPISRDESITPTSARQQLESREPKKFRRPTHDDYTASLFNNAGYLMPSIPGIDSVTERLFDKGEIMSLRPPRPNDGYYPDGEPRGGSFLMDYSNEKKRTRDD